MKKIIIASTTLFLAFGLLTMQSCKKDESPTPIVKYTAAIPVATSPVVNTDGTVFFTGTTVDLKWAAENKGKAAVWDVYFGTSKDPALKQKGVAGTTLTVNVEDGFTYYWKVECTDDAGIKTTSQIFKFTAVNGSNPKLTVNLGVTTNVKTAIGVDLTADEVIDLRFLIVNKETNAIVKTVNAGKANEVYREFASLPDGNYLLGVDIASTLNFGSINKPVDLSLSLKFAQLGVIDTTLAFPNVMNNVNSCSIYRTYLATVVKVGSLYTVASTVSYWSDAVTNPTALVGTWSGYDADAAWPSEVTSSIVSGALKFTGIGRGWMQDPTNGWGEVITKQYPISMNLNYCAGTVTIPKQKIMETTYKGDAQPAYSISGSGTFDMSGDYPSMIIKYDFIQGTTTIAKYFGLPYFTMEISLAPGKKSPIGSGNIVPAFPILPKR